CARVRGENPPYYYSGSYFPFYFDSW
nr:immunoglobulin heavy chain junction region [Macaca mulatta]MOX15573.1 immunoglobulin heavy chain junction region [Macaca mulatta]MOX15966.1 immunoglobulin heavy chain junction region [Macaca mulatta]